MSEVKFDENSARAKIDALLEQKWPFERYNAGNVVISRGTVAICFWEIARWQFEQDKAVIETLKSENSALEERMKIVRGSASMTFNEFIEEKNELKAVIEGKDKEIERLQRWGDHWHQLCADHLPREIWCENRFKEFK